MNNLNKQTILHLITCLIPFIVFVFILPFIFSSTCNGESIRKDSTENKALENLCNGKTAEKFLEKGVSVAREYVCLCQQAAKQSDQNLCRQTINLNNGKDLIETCKKLFGTKDATGNYKASDSSMRVCKELFNSVK